MDSPPSIVSVIYYDLKSIRRYLGDYNESRRVYYLKIIKK